jgi:hypothetical protein
MRTWARTLSPYLDVDAVTDQWRDAMIAKGYRYVDWQAAWRTGIRKALEWGNAPMMPLSWVPPSSTGDPHD